MGLYCPYGSLLWSYDDPRIHHLWYCAVPMYGSLTYALLLFLCSAHVWGALFFLWRYHAWYLLFLWRPHVWACALSKRASLINLDCFHVVFQISCFLLEGLKYEFLLVSPRPIRMVPSFPMDFLTYGPLLSQRKASLMGLWCSHCGSDLWVSTVPVQGLCCSHGKPHC